VIEDYGLSRIFTVAGSSGVTCRSLWREGSTGRGGFKEASEAFEKAKAQVRALVEHLFHILKNLFKHRKTHLRGLSTNTAQLHTLFA